MKEHKTLDFYFEWGLYPLRDEERNALELKEIRDLGLSEELVQRIHNLAVWNDSRLNPIYQMLPCLWQQQVCDAFNREASAVFKAVVAALPHIRVNRCFSGIEEDPELYEYLLHPVQFYKRKGISGYDQL